MLADAIFAENRVDVFAAYSELDECIRKFDTASELIRYAESKFDNGTHVHISIRYPDSGPDVIIKKINLRPETGAAVRYSVSGWGLISILCENAHGDDLVGTVSVNTQTRALSWHPAAPELGDPMGWNWPLVERHMRRLKRVVKKLETEFSRKPSTLSRH